MGDLLRIGSMYAGIGGLDLACEWALNGRTVWQLDKVNEDVRRRHWPDAVQTVGDVAGIDPLTLPPIDVLCAGFACQDLSVAGSGESRPDLHAGDKTGATYRGVLRFVDSLDPFIVVLENVPAVLAHRSRIERDLSGYSWVWVRSNASDVGATHQRSRVFAVGRKDGPSGIMRLPSNPTTGRRWLTMTATDHKTPAGYTRPNGHSPARTAEQMFGEQGRRVNPAWTECMMGFPVGWTRPVGPQQTAVAAPAWPRGRYPADWDTSAYWAGKAWEPPRTLPDGPKFKHWASRLKACGNAVCPQQGAASIKAGLIGPSQLGMFATTQENNQ